MRAIPYDNGGLNVASPTSLQARIKAIVYPLL